MTHSIIYLRTALLNSLKIGLKFKFPHSLRAKITMVFRTLFFICGSNYMSDTFSAFKLAYELFIFFVQKGAKKIEKSENISKTKSLIKVLSYS